MDPVARLPPCLRLPMFDHNETLQEARERNIRDAPV